MREFLIKKSEIVSLIDFSDKAVFLDASTYPVISFFKKKTTSEYFIVTGKFDETSKQLISKKFPSNKLEILDDSILGFLLNDKLEITEKIIAQSESLQNVGKINATSTAKEADEYSVLINEESGFKLINTGTIDPYISDWGLKELIDKGKKFIKPYLPNEHKAISSNRLNLYKSPKIIISKIGLRCEAFYDKNSEFASINTNCIHSFDNNYLPEYVLCWINSKLYNYLFECFFDGLRMSGGYLLYSSPNLKNTYIKKAPLNIQSSFVEKADLMLFLKTQLQEKKNRFLELLKANVDYNQNSKKQNNKEQLNNGVNPVVNETTVVESHAGFKVSKKLESFYDYDFKTFVAEISKAFKTVGLTRRFTLVQQDEWEEYFTTYKTEINQLQSEISKTDKEIDQMVYELYGLTEEEIEIVENSIN